MKAEINGKEISTMVSTSELSITSGSTLHQLTVRALINDWEDGLLAPDHLHHQVGRREIGERVKAGRAGFARS